jgi:hypothetical protein
LTLAKPCYEKLEIPWELFSRTKNFGLCKGARKRENPLTTFLVVCCVSLGCEDGYDVVCTCLRNENIDSCMAVEKNEIKNCVYPHKNLEVKIIECINICWNIYENVFIELNDRVHAL